jgi:transposase-like protein
MFNENQVNELSKNKNVLRCSNKSITYSQEFKLKALKLYFEEGVCPNQIFEEAGFPQGWLGKYRASNCLKKWKDKYKNEGQDSLLKETRGAPGKRKTWMVPKDEKKKIEYLETKIAYLEAENDFLAKLRGLKRK